MFMSMTKMTTTMMMILLLMMTMLGSFLSHLVLFL